MQSYIYLNLLLYLFSSLYHNQNDGNKTNFRRNIIEEMHVPARRIISGHTALSTSAFPYMAAVQFQTFNGQRLQICGGTIIARRWVLTAAHCFNPSKFLEGNYEVRVGFTSLLKGGKAYRLTKIFIHPMYNNGSQNDIALVKTNRPMEFSDSVNSLPLNYDEISDGAIVTVSGWGTLTTNGPASIDLQYVNLRTISYNSCKEKWKSLVWPHHICTSTTAGAGTCFGDSGGPLEYNGTVAGVTIFGHSATDSCAGGRPNVYTKVKDYVTWIRVVQAGLMPPTYLIFL